jgi:hypothetical protein
MWITVGPSGSDVSYNDGESWETFDSGNYNAVSFVNSHAGWAVGAVGKVAKFSLKSER